MMDEVKGGLKRPSEETCNRALWIPVVVEISEVTESHRHTKGFSDKKNINIDQKRRKHQ